MAHAYLCTCGRLLPKRGNCGCRPPSPQRRARSSALYQRQRQLALNRDNHRCTNCNATTKLETHHINGDATDHRLDNLTTLCTTCHHAAGRFFRDAVPDPRRAFREKNRESREEWPSVG